MNKIFSVRYENSKKVINLFGLKIKFSTKYSRLKDKFDKLEAKLAPIIMLQSLKTINKEKITSKIENLKVSGINNQKRDKKIILSMTSYPERLYDIHFAIYSLLTQTCKPDQFILWLAKDEFPNRENDLPKTLKILQKFGLTIKWCEAIRSFKKIVPVLKNAHDPHSLIVTADDDIFYDNDWLEGLYKEHLKHPEDIICYRAHKIILKNNKLAGYNEWTKCINDNSSSFFNFITSVGGVLYPPNSLYKDVCNIELLRELTPDNDDIWVWAMAVLNNTSIRVPENTKNELRYINPERELNLNDDKTLASTNLTGNNDIQMQKILNYYPEIMGKLKHKLLR